MSLDFKKISATQFDKDTEVCKASLDMYTRVTIPTCRLVNCDDCQNENHYGSPTGTQFIKNFSDSAYLTKFQHESKRK